MRILHKGRALHDDDTLQAAGVNDGNKLYVAQNSGTSLDIDSSALVPQPGQEPAASNDPLAQMMQSPMVSAMLDNPEVLRSMLQANPQMRQVMENNPELGHLLNDPQILRQSLQASRNPQLMREQMRNTDRALSNIEAIPGGHNMLRRMYETVQAPLYDVDGSSMMQGAMGGGGAGGGAGAGGASSGEGGSPTPPAGPNTAALPNPWAQPQQPQQPPGGGGFPPFGFGGGGRGGGGFGGGGFGGGGGWGGRGGGGFGGGRGGGF